MVTLNITTILKNLFVVGKLPKGPLKKQKTALSVLALFGLIAFLSGLSGFHIRNPENAMNFDIATMLTPLGLFKNFALKSNPVLMPFYWRASSRPGIFGSPVAGALIILVFGVSILILVRLRRLAQLSRPTRLKSK